MALSGRNSKKKIYAGSGKEQRRWKAMLQAEFKEFLQSGKSVLSAEKSAVLLEKIHDRITTTGMAPQRKTRSTVILSAVWTRWAAAAIIILMAGAAWHYYTTDSKQAIAVAALESRKNSMIIESNNSDTLRRLLLSDKTIVKLSKGSTISYPLSFDTGRRDIRLSGKAVFEVAKNTARPFTVYADGINTIVLGTRFMMSTLEKNKVRVQLFEGKVVIHAAAGAFGMHDVYLKAGEQFIIDKQLGQYTVTPFKDNTGIPDTKTPGVTTITAPGMDNAALEFNQEPLAKVLAEIGKRYNVQFKFEDDSFNTMLVTGKLLPSDSLEVVLSMLGSINRLSFKVHNNKIEVARIK